MTAKIPPYLDIRGIEVDIEEPEDDAVDNTEAERSEQFNTFTLMQTLLLILRFAAARQRRQVIRLLANSEIGRLFHFATNSLDDFADEEEEDQEEDDDYDDDDEFYDPTFRRRRRRARPDPNRFPKVPSDKGLELMNSGTFGSSEIDTIASGNISKKKKLAIRILDRELATEGYAQQRVNQRLMAQVGASAISPVYN